ncbi:MAG: hypothetical protein WBK77_00630 [Alphaproteobacteria bacterium]
MHLTSELPTVGPAAQICYLLAALFYIIGSTIFAIIIYTILETYLDKQKNEAQNTAKKILKLTLSFIVFYITFALSFTAMFYFNIIAIEYLIFFIPILSATLITSLARTLFFKEIQKTPLLKRSTKKIITVTSIVFIMCINIALIFSVFSVLIFYIPFPPDIKIGLLILIPICFFPLILNYIFARIFPSRNLIPYKPLTLYCLLSYTFEVMPAIMKWFFTTTAIG